VDGEDALTCAARELLEETGYRHREIEFLGGYYASAGFTDEHVHLFWARTDAEPESEAEDGIEVIRMPFTQMVDAAREGKVRDAKTALALLLAAGRPSLP
jgi:ADP-ribose pyrophosphatase